MGDLSGEGLVVHEEEVNIADVVDEESLVARWHHVASLLVGTETDLRKKVSPIFSKHSIEGRLRCHSKTYRWHNHLAAKASADTVVDTLWLSP